ncbi:MAG: IS1595 family transposase [Planctomycetes bacterium]|nr:IS1595 family transposase [Planctomycetota bacterium]
MEDYPPTLAEFERRFSTEADCRAYLAQLRWPGGFRCPRCAGPGWPMKRGPIKCGNCGHQASVTAGTIFHRSHLPLRTWFRAMWWVTNQKQGISALGLQRLLGLGSYETAWACLQKLRRAMLRPGRDRLTGKVEVDETYVGGVEPGGGRRHLGNKALVAVAAQVDGEGIGRIRLRRIPDASARSLHAFVKEAVEPGSTVITDGWEGYEGLQGLKYKHKLRVISGSGKTASTLLPRVHRVASLLKRWLLGTHQGGVSREQLDYYLDEFTFRFNRRTSGHRGKLFYRLAEQAVAIDPVPFPELVATERHNI